MEGDGAGYWSWISDYLYFYDAPFDSRVGDAIADRVPGSLMLVPLGERNPVVFQRDNYAGDWYTHTHSVNAFYAPPAP